MTATTTAKAIRDAMIVAMNDALCSVREEHRFVQHREAVPLREWAPEHPQAALRRYSIRDTGGSSPPLVASAGVEQVERQFECVVSYPAGGVFAPGTFDLDTLIESDLTEVLTTIGTTAASSLEAATGAVPVVEHGEASIEVGDACRFLVVPLRVLYYRSMPT